MSTPKHGLYCADFVTDTLRTCVETLASDVLHRRHRERLASLEQLGHIDKLAKECVWLTLRLVFLLAMEPQPGTTPKGASGGHLSSLTPPHGAAMDHATAMGTALYDHITAVTTHMAYGHNCEAGVFSSTPLDIELLTQALPLLDETGVSNHAVGHVLTTLTRTPNGEPLGWSHVHYPRFWNFAETAMDYKGVVPAETSICAKSKAGKGEAGGVFLVPLRRDPARHVGTAAPGDTDLIPLRKDQYVLGPDKNPLIFAAGQFYWLPLGCAREKSASFYTPQVLTTFTVNQALEEFAADHGDDLKAEHLNRFTLCEPAMGAGAFLIDGLRQITALHMYLHERECTTPNVRRREHAIQATKAVHVADAYGVDLNPGVVPITEANLALDCLHPIRIPPRAAA